MNADIHRFNNHVALAFIGSDGGTVYLTATDALIIARTLAQFAEDIHAKKFTDSTLPTVSWPLSNGGKK